MRPGRAPGREQNKWEYRSAEKGAKWVDEGNGEKGGPKCEARMAREGEGEGRGIENKNEWGARCSKRGRS